MATIIDGKKISQKIKDELKEEIQKFGLKPGLAVVIVGDDPASAIYVKHKKKACAEIGIDSISHELPATTSEAELLELIDSLNQNPRVHGILVQLPLPKTINENKIISAINPNKDVDGFHPLNVGALTAGSPGFVSCTPAGIIELLERYNVEIEGKHCVIVGRSNIVGKPIALLLLQRHGTITICHSRTPNLEKVTIQADILVAAVGKAGIISGKMVKPGATIIDVGMNRSPDNKLVGDVDFVSVEPIAQAITPVPGGVGPMTIAMLLKNTVLAAKQQKND